MAKRRKVKKKALFKVILFTIIILVSSCFIIDFMNKNKTKEGFLASDTPMVSLYDENKTVTIEEVRGKKVLVFTKQVLDENYIKIKYNNKEYYVNKDNIVYETSDIVKEKEVYVRTSYDINKSLETSELLTLANKGDKLKVIGYDSLMSDGHVNMYKIETDEGKAGYFYSKYTVYNEEESLQNYDSDGLYKIHASKKDNLGGGDGASLDYFPVIKASFENNKMPDNVYSLYLNGTKAVISKVDDYIAYAKTTKINAFVVDIKDSGVSAYASPVMQEYSKTSYKYAQNSLESYKEAIKKIKEAGFYVIGRITTFKDTYYVSDNKDMAISDTSNKPLLHQKSYWPSAYSRDVWEYNILLAKEAVSLMGFNEIQFDYVRFPDGLRTMEKNNKVNYKNIYNETKAQAVQRFLMYACNELHKLNVYVSADVFGESSWGYVPAYGQYWPAISNVVDVISAMPYTDHFGNSYGGHSEPWRYPYDTVKTWAKTASDRQKEIPSPAIARTWITAYNTPHWNQTIKYDDEKVAEQIKALYDTGLTGGFMTWNSLSSLDRYKTQESAYNKEYR